MENLNFKAYTTYFVKFFFLFIILNSTCLIADEHTKDIIGYELETLMDMEISIANKKPQKVSDVAAAVHVISAEEIRRSTAKSIPELLRTVPGLQVAQINARLWSVTARGFNSLYANKLLVLIDGRSVYTPLFGGTYWDLQDTMLEDIERIEVIRGPGASVWGSNAVNGVINIITKDANSTPGGLFVAGTGTELQSLGAARYGEKLDDDSAIRFYAKSFKIDSGERLSGEDAYDSWNSNRAGFRYDKHFSEDETLTFQGDIFGSRADTEAVAPVSHEPYIAKEQDRNSSNGGNILTRWQKAFSDSSDVSLQLYYDRTEREELFIYEDRDTYDLDFQHHYKVFDHHDLVWGINYRFTSDDTQSRSIIDVQPESRDIHLFSAFAQDEITLVEDQLKFLMGVKVEEHKFSGFEVQPTARMLWNVDDTNTLWSSFSRAVRVPTRVDNDIAIDLRFEETPDGVPVIGRAFGNEDVDSEELLATELGYRFQHSLFSLDFSAFYNFYDSYRNIEPGEPYMESNYVIVPFTIDNKAEADSTGFEVLAEVYPEEDWKLSASYSFNHVNIRLNDDSLDPATKSDESFSPEHQFYIRSEYNLFKNIELDAFLRYVDRIATFNVDKYWDMDLRVAWQIDDNLNIALIGQNLFHSQRREFEAEFIRYTPTRLQRAVYGKLTLTF